MGRVHRSRISVEVPGNPGLYLLPAGLSSAWEILGTVTDANGVGALVRNRQTGIYCRANAGAISSLPQDKVKAAVAASHCP